MSKRKAKTLVVSFGTYAGKQVFKIEIVEGKPAVRIVFEEDVPTLIIEAGQEYADSEYTPTLNVYYETQEQRTVTETKTHPICTLSKDG